MLSRILLRLLKGSLFMVILACFVCIITMFQSIEYNPASDQRTEKNRNKGVNVRTFTQVLTMPGGDDVPSSPPWTIPTVPVIKDAWDLPPESNSTRYLITKFSMSPGQGNLMFQYASLFAIARRYNATVLIPEGMLLRRAFRLDSALVVSFRTSMYVLKNWTRRAYPDCCRFYEEATRLENGTRFAMYGYFQSYKYFHHDEESRRAVKAQFEFLPEIRAFARDHLKSALDNVPDRNPVLVGVHVRRGLDMTWNARNQKHGHTVASKDYFIKAMDYFRRKFENSTVLFIVCTDDLYWTKQYLGVYKDVRVVNSRTREVDMCVLSMCNHTIMSQGTFSWWAAYLAGGETVYFDGWPRPHSELAGMLRKEDFFLPEWIPMQ